MPDETEQASQEAAAAQEAASQVPAGEDQEPTSQTAPDAQETAEVNAELVALQAQIDQLKQENINIQRTKDAEVARARRTEMQLLSEKTEEQRREFRRLRDSEDPDERDKALAMIRDNDNRATIKQEAFEDISREARANAWADPAFADLSIEERSAIEQRVAGGGGGVVQVVAGWAQALKEKGVSGVRQEIAQLQAQMTALVNGRTAEAVEGEEGPEKPAAGTGGDKELAGKINDGSASLAEIREANKRGLLNY